MTIQDFQEFVIDNIKSKGKMVLVPSFLCSLYVHPKKNEGKVDYYPLPFEFFTYPPENIKIYAKELLEKRLSERENLQGYDLSMICSGTSAILTTYEEETEYLKDIDPSLIPGSRPGLVMVFENQLVSKTVMIPIENGELDTDNINESVLYKEFLVSGILRHIQPLN